MRGILCAGRLELSVRRSTVDISRAPVQPDYRAINPKSKVPRALVGGRLLTETGHHPVADLKPPRRDAASRRRPLSRRRHLPIWSGVPTRCTHSPEPPHAAAHDFRRSRAGSRIAVAAMLPILESIDARISNHPWVRRTLVGGRCLSLVDTGDVRRRRDGSEPISGTRRAQLRGTGATRFQRVLLREPAPRCRRDRTAGRGPPLDQNRARIRCLMRYSQRCAGRRFGAAAAFRY